VGTHLAGGFGGNQAGECLQSQGYLGLTKDECEKIAGAKFQPAG
jgi:hypothetical protein